MCRFGLVLVLILLSAKSFSCTCFFSIEDSVLKRKIKTTDIVVYGMVQQDHTLKNKYSADSTTIEYNFYVVKVWKGKAKGLVKLKLWGDSCGTYTSGEYYILWANMDKETNIINSSYCSSLSEETKPDSGDTSTARRKNGFKYVMNFLNKEAKNE